MKKYDEKVYFTVSAMVTYKTKKKLYEIAHLEKTTVSELTRRFIEKCLCEYEEVNDVK